jgi:hypothetical protein
VQDRPLPLGPVETISAPHMHARALDLLVSRLKPGARVLDVGSVWPLWRLSVHTVKQVAKPAMHSRLRPFYCPVTHVSFVMRSWKVCLEAHISLLSVPVRQKDLRQKTLRGILMCESIWLRSLMSTKFTGLRVALVFTMCASM